MTKPPLRAFSLALLVLSCPLVAQGETDRAEPAAPKVDKISNYADGSVGGRLVRKGRPELLFHLDVADDKSMLWIHAKYRTDPSAQKAPHGSKAERDVFVGLRAWRRAAFSANEREIYYGVERLHNKKDPANGNKPMKWARYLEAQVLRATRRYELRTRTTIDDVKRRPGNGLRLNLGFGNTHYARVFMREHQKEPRLFLDDREAPLEIGSPKELEILAIVQAWIDRKADAATQARLAAGKKLEDIDASLVAVYEVFRHYRERCYPRLVDFAMLRDGGSVRFRLIIDAKHSSVVMFDRAIGSKTHGRLKALSGRAFRLLPYKSRNEERIVEALETWVARMRKDVRPSDRRTLKIILPLYSKYRAMRKAAAKVDVGKG